MRPVRWEYACMLKPTEHEVREAMRRHTLRDGVNRTSVRLRISREAVARIAGGLDCRAGSLALAAERLAELGELRAR